LADTLVAQEIVAVAAISEHAGRLGEVGDVIAVVEIDLILVRLKSRLNVLPTASLKTDIPNSLIFRI